MRTPCAADVAAATCGLARLMHIPKVGILVPGAKSITVHAGVVAVTMPAAEVALITDGVVPIEHCSCDPDVTLKGISVTSTIQCLT